MSASEAAPCANLSDLPLGDAPAELLIGHYVPHPGSFRHAAVLQGRWAWAPLEALAPYLAALQPTATEERRRALRSAPSVCLRAGEIEGSLVLEEGAEIEPFVLIRATAGGLYLERGARICAFCRIEVTGGDLYLEEDARLEAGCDWVGCGCVGRGSVVAGSLIRGKVLLGAETRVNRAAIHGPACLGDHCDIRPGAFVRENSLFGDHIEFRSESKNAILMDGACDSDYLTAADHYAYIGDSLIGPQVNLGAGVITSNLKVDRSGITVSVGGTRYATGLIKLGAVVGQLSQLGCHTVLDPGALVGPETHTYPGAILRGYYPPRSIVKVRQAQEVVQRW